MTFRTIDTDMETVGATTASDLTTGVARRARSARRASVLGSRFRGSRVAAYGNF